MKVLRRFFNRVVHLATIWAQDERLRDEIEEHIALQTDSADRGQPSGLHPCTDDSIRSSQGIFSALCQMLQCGATHRADSPHNGVVTLPHRGEVLWV